MQMMKKRISKKSLTTTILTLMIRTKTQLTLWIPQILLTLWIPQILQTLWSLTSGMSVRRCVSHTLILSSRALSNKSKATSKPQVTHPPTPCTSTRASCPTHPLSHSTASKTSKSSSSRKATIQPLFAKFSFKLQRSTMCRLSATMRSQSIWASSTKSQSSCKKMQIWATTCSIQHTGLQMIWMLTSVARMQSIRIGAEKYEENLIGQCNGDSRS